MGLVKLPNELILMLDDWADVPTLAALARTSRRLHDLMNPVLYRRSAKEQHSSALLWAAENGLVETVKLCLSHGADINLPLSLQEDAQVGDVPASGTPLHYAVRRGHDDLVEYLLDNGADHQCWCTHLCECEIPVSADILHGVKTWTFHWSPLHLALCKDHTSTAKMLLERGVSCKRTLQVSWGHGPTAKEPYSTTFNVVHEIAIHKSAEVLDYMIATNYPLGPLSGVQTLNGNTPLHYLAIKHSQHSFTILSQLLNTVSPRLDTNNDSFLRPIECFIQAGDIEAARLLFSLGARPYQIDSCIQSAARINIRESGQLGRDRMERRNELFLWLLDHAMANCFLLRDVSENYIIAGRWHRVFFAASKQPALLQRLLDEGFKPSLLTRGHGLLTALVQFLTRVKGLDSDLARSCCGSIRLLTRAGERWDERTTTTNSISTTPLEYLVKHCGHVAREVRETLIGCLLDTRPPEETGAERAHLDSLCQYALGQGDTQTCEALIRHVAKSSNSYRRSKPGLQAETSATRTSPIRTRSRCKRTKETT
ncbi:hypothetical protein KVR01_012935 [Diaporthe batatas]|uniref:uncharacterized protein n=1 Tax=Diaporthe batatas TaxID=748121 RepID=UPI001D04B197|nr:uncharacterized protein KVR01_012935 [Diaporthe batatas]KAG8157227.1 hypothetical protein KVR01_012935 [Diaporthe batatas]